MEKYFIFFIEIIFLYDSLNKLTMALLLNLIYHLQFYSFHAEFCRYMTAPYDRQLLSDGSIGSPSSW
jgi:hypothetical protein